MKILFIVFIMLFNLNFSFSQNILDLVETLSNIKVDQIEKLKNSFSPDAIKKLNDNIKQKDTSKYLDKIKDDIKKTLPDTIKLKPQIEIDTYIDQQATLKIITDYKPMYDQKLLDFKSLDEHEITFLNDLDNFIHGVE